MKGQESAGFDDLVDGWVLGAVESGTVGFSQLISALPGVYPASVRDSLCRLARDDRLPRALVAKMLAEAAQLPSFHRNGLPSGLPAPHPLDFDWRYAPAATEHLLDKCEGLAGPTGTLVLLGAPSVLPGALTRKPQRDVVALDSNPAIVTALRENYPGARVILCDITREEPQIVAEAAVVVSDPPWYPEYLHSFLWTACRICKPGGHTLMTLPPLGTRPGMNKDREQILTLAEQMGLRLIALEKGVLPYLSPLFERNALRADGVPGVPFDWRRADLAVFLHSGACAAPRPLVRLLEDVWPEVTISGVRTRLRHPSAQRFEDPRLVSLVPGDILPTVSRRDPRRTYADVWTMGNRIFACRGTGILLQIFQALGSGELPAGRVTAGLRRELNPREARLVERAFEQALDLINIERNEQLSWEQYYRGEELSGTAV